MTISEPMPGIEKMFSITSESPISKPVLTPNTVMSEKAKGAAHGGS